MIPFAASKTAWMSGRWISLAPIFSVRDARVSRTPAVAVAVFVSLLSPDLPARAGQSADPRQQSKLGDVLRRESDALVQIADAAMHGRRSASDFSIEWRNDFLKAQPGTFVPFTVALDTTLRSPMGALMYVRVVERPVNPARQRRQDLAFPYETVFPIALEQASALPVRIRRGFAVPPGNYTVLDRPQGAAGQSTRHQQATAGTDGPADAGPRRPGLLDRHAGDQHRHPGGPHRAVERSPPPGTARREPLCCWDESDSSRRTRRPSGDQRS